MLSTKAIIAIVVGSGSVVGGIYGVVEYIGHLSNSHKQQINKTSAEPVGSAQTTSEDSSTLNSASGSSSSADKASPEGIVSSSDELSTESSPLMQQETVSSVSPEEDELEDEEMADSKVAGTLAVVTGSMTSHELKVFFEGQRFEEESASILEVAFKSERDVATRCVNLFNVSLWDENSLSSFLATLKNKKGDLEKVFGSPVLEELVKKIKSRISSE
ncbi:hypothetical protein MHLP_02160 [Candidatus Mycoplasma haematolamae str. Purdue]|uniref:Uncharacterized protein n=1 Tax=Mycoplasma haematolamae (strain Purdue) TaxID=1212765 RepID=I7C694_MYCHA|nr:hypothetical protein [Candidatus Mycoplasma haematolamae]AFO52012.1 hypothetical protein MHLP_02160 [Candidatus Mycoplasma haematolamae str. Purdue]